MKSNLEDVASDRAVEIRLLQAANRTTTAQLEEARRRENSANRRLEHLSAIEQSTIWRVSAPLRVVASSFPRMRKLVRGGIKLIWWTATLQLWSRLQERRLRLKGPAGEAPADPVDVASSSPTGPQPLTDAQIHAQRAALGAFTPAPSVTIAVGVVNSDSSAKQLEQCFGSARLALARAGGDGRRLILDVGERSTPIDGVDRLESLGEAGSAAGHNRLMKFAFDAGADVYVAASPDGMFHPDCLTRLAQMHAAQDGRALIAACEFPRQHSKSYDPVTFRTAWVARACLWVPRQVYEAVGGFDEALFMGAEDVDLSWRTRASGLEVLVNPAALFFHFVSDRTNNPGASCVTLSAGHALAKKWGNDGFAAWTAAQMALTGESPPEVVPEPVPEAWQSIPDFGHHLAFSEVRW